MSTTETNIQKEIRLHLSRQGALSLRYQVGTFFTLDGRYVDIGEVGASDLICCVPITITPDMVGKRIGVFAAIETKKVNDSTTKKRKEAQGKFLARIRALGGFATIARNTADVDNALKL